MDYLTVSLRLFDSFANSQLQGIHEHPAISGQHSKTFFHLDSMYLMRFFTIIDEIPKFLNQSKIKSKDTYMVLDNTQKSFHIFLFFRPVLLTNFSGDCFDVEMGII